MYKKKSLFVTFEGIEGSGKTFQSKKLFRKIKSMGLHAIYTREPGGTRAAEKIREVILKDYVYYYVREMGTFQADWYSFTIDEPSFVNLTIVTNYQTDDVGFYVYEDDLFTTYDPDIQYIPIAGVRNFWFTNYAMMNLGLYSPGTYTLQVIGFSMFPNTPNADFGPYLLQTSTPLTYRYSTWFNTLSMSGLPSTYPSHVNVSFLGHLYSEEVDTGIAGWMDHGSTIHASRSIEVTESERYSTSAATSFLSLIHI